MQTQTKKLLLYINERRIVRDNIGPLKTLARIVITTDNDMANTTNNYFSSVFTIEQLNNISQVFQYEGNILDTFNFSSEEEQEKQQHLNIHKSTKPDMLHPRILRELKTRIIHEDWKSENVTAIHEN